MKKIAFMLALSVAVLTSCQKNEETALVLENEVFTASVESFDAQTKTSMTQDRQVVWSQDDRLAIFQGSTLADEYKVTDAGEGNANATFVLVTDNSEVNGDFSAGVEVPRNIAFYPYASGLSITASTIDDEGTSYKITGYELPETQYYAAGSFGNGVFPMTAVTSSMSDHNLKFRNILGAMKLRLKGTQTVKSIKVEGKNNEKLSGAAVITAYATNLTPAITMAETAGTSVTLDCGDGVRLNESTATDFFIALPPVLFSQGFTVTVTDDASQIYTIETSVANTVLRSSILVMPAVRLGENESEGGSGSDEESIPVAGVSIDYNSMTLAPGMTYTFVTKIAPTDADEKALTWSSSDSQVLSVNQSGVITAHKEGKVVITALATSGVSATCNVEVKTMTGVATTDYVDEYNINHGKGIVIGGVVWAPVNCGYKDVLYPYGKIYQWGRKYGQACSEDNIDAEIIDGPVGISIGMDKNNEKKFYEGFREYNYDWLNPSDDSLWNEGTNSEPVKNELYDPCPEGWRVPTDNEIAQLRQNYSITTNNEENKSGRYFSGEYTYIDGVSKVFLLAAPYVNESGEVYFWNGSAGKYYSSTPYNNRYVNGLHFSSTAVSKKSSHIYRACGCSVRCVQE